MRVGVGVGSRYGFEASRSRIIATPLVPGFAPQGNGTVLLPTYMSMVCATTSRTSQTSANTIRTGFGANAARARSTNGTTWGVSVETARTNFILWSEQADHAGWTVTANATVAANSVAAPDGNVTADTLDYAGGGTPSLYRLFETGHTYANTTKFVISTWIMLASDSPVIRLDNGYSTPTVTPTAAWVRYDNSGTSDGVNTSQLLYRSPLASTTAFHIYVFGAQSETGLYPGSYVPTTSASVARAQDLLTITSPSAVAPGGFFNIDMTVAPNYSQAEFAADHNMLYFDANNRIFLRQTDQKMVLRIGGSNVAISGALTFAREDALRIRAQHTSVGKRLRVDKNGSSVYDSGLLSPGSAITLPGALGLLSDGATTPESADLRAFVPLAVA